MARQRADKEDIEAWRELYAAARAFNELQPWKQMSDDLLFGVLDPASQRMGYCCVLGAVRQVFALVVYRGAEGYDCYRKMRGVKSPTDFEDVMAENDCLMADFVDYEEVWKEDKAMMRAAGARFSGPNMFPVFRSTRLGRIPWHINRAEALVLAGALRRAVAVYEGCAAGTLDLASRPGSILCFDSSDGRWEPEPAPPAKDVAALAVDPDTAMSLRTLPVLPGSVWEADASGTSSIVKDAEGPYFAEVALVVDRASRFIFELAMFSPADSPTQRAADALSAAIRKAGFRPGKAVVRSQDLLVALRPLAAAFDIALERGAVRSLLEVRADMTRAMKRGAS